MILGTAVVTSDVCVFGATVTMTLCDYMFFNSALLTPTKETHSGGTLVCRYS